MDVGRFLSDPVYFEKQMDDIQLEAEMRKIEGLIPIVDRPEGPSGFSTMKHHSKKGTKAQRRAKNKRSSDARRRNR